MRTLLCTLALPGVLSAQFNDNRIHIPDSQIEGLPATYRLVVDATGTSSVRLVVVKKTGTQQLEVTDLDLVGHYAGFPTQIRGTSRFIVPTMTPDGNAATRLDGYVNLVEVVVVNGSVTVLNATAQAHYPGMDPTALFFDAENSALYMLDIAHGVLRRATCNGQSLPAANAWSTLADSNSWNGREALTTSLPIRTDASSSTWFSLAQPGVLRNVTASGVHLVTDADELVTFVDYPYANTARTWGFSGGAAPGTRFDVTSTDGRTVYHSGTIISEDSTTVPALTALNGAPAGKVRLTIAGRGSVSVIPIECRYGRSVGNSALTIGRMLTGTRRAVGTRVLPYAVAELSATSMRCWLLLAWRDPTTGSDPLRWSGDIAVLDTDSRGAAVEFTASQPDVWGGLCLSTMLPPDADLGGGVLLAQYVCLVGAEYCVSDVAACTVDEVGYAPTATAHDAAVANWRGSFAPSTLDTSEALRSLTGR